MHDACDGHDLNVLELAQNRARRLHRSGIVGDENGIAPAKGRFGIVAR